MAAQSYTITELEQFFATVKLPKEVSLDPASKITEVKKFVESHLAVLKQSGDKPVFHSFYSRLCQLKELLETRAGKSLS